MLRSARDLSEVIDAVAEWGFPVGRGRDFLVICLDFALGSFFLQIMIEEVRIKWLQSILDTFDGLHPEKLKMAKNVTFSPSYFCTFRSICLFLVFCGANRQK